MNFKQIDCFSIHMEYWKFLGVYPKVDCFAHYKIYSKAFITIVITIYMFLYTVTFYFLPKELDGFVDQMILYVSCVSVSSKALTFYFQREKMQKILLTLENDNFQADSDVEDNIIKKAKKFNRNYWKAMAMFSYTSQITHTLSPLIAHFFLKEDMTLPVCPYLFLSEDTIKKYIYAIYMYQSFGMHCHMLYNLNIDTFFLGLMVLGIAQLDILDMRLRNLTQNIEMNDFNTEKELILKMNNLFVHFEEVASYCKLIQDVFSVTLFVQLGVASCVICVCLYRFTLPAPGSQGFNSTYFVFLVTYMCIMIIQILMPCWFGNQIIDKSSSLSVAIYYCDWTSRSKSFKSSLRIFVERVKNPITIVASKMFPLSLETFTSIMNSAYSFYTLLRNMQKRDDGFNN